MRESISYEFEDVAFEFTPDGNLTEGRLVAEIGEAVFVSDVKLTSIRNRRSYAKAAAETHGEFATDALIRALNDFAMHQVEAEQIAAARAAENEDEEEISPLAPEEGTPEYDAAMKLLKGEKILDRAARDMRSLGHVGEWPNKKLAFICAISAKAQLPVQPSTHAQSSAGKNFLWDTVLSLLPPELVYKRTGFSAKALFRTQMSLKHSVLYIQELAGSEGAEFSIRTLQSDGVLKWEATEKQADGTMANVEYEVEGPTVIVQTTTRNHLHPENETRVVPLYLDESSAQTEKITKTALRFATGKGEISQARREEICSVWHNAIRLLEPKPVVIPYAEDIEVPAAPLRLRRDVPRLLNIIKLVAWLHQHTRERDEEGRIVATVGDFYTAVELVGDSFARAWKALTPNEEKVYNACTSLNENLRKHGFKRSHVETALEKAGETIPTRTVQECLYTLSKEAGYLETDGKRGPGGATYTVTGGRQLIVSITLPAHCALGQKSGEPRRGKAFSSTQDRFADYRALRISEDVMRNAQESAKDSCALENAISKPNTADFDPNAQCAKGDEKENKNEEEGEDDDFQVIDG